MLVMGGIYVSCTSVTDELTELSLTRCLEPLNLDYTISNGDSVIFSWDLVTGSDKFALQIAKDSCAFRYLAVFSLTPTRHITSVYRLRYPTTARNSQNGQFTLTPSPPTLSAATSTPR